MEMFEEMNKKLDQGWKMTDSTCEECKSVVMFNPHKSTLVCLLGKHPNSEKPFDSPKSESSQSQFVQVATPVMTRNTRSDQISKKLGEKLIQGWTMLQQACYACNVPIMRSKKGQSICLGCNKTNFSSPSKVETIKQEPKKQQVKRIQKQQQSKIQAKQEQIERKNCHEKVQNNGKESYHCKNSEIQNRIQNIMLSATSFFEKRMNQQIENNNLHGVNQILSSLQKLNKIKNDL